MPENKGQVRGPVMGWRSQQNSHAALSVNHVSWLSPLMVVAARKWHLRKLANAPTARTTHHIHIRAPP